MRLGDLCDEGPWWKSGQGGRNDDVNVLVGVWVTRSWKRQLGGRSVGVPPPDNTRSPSLSDTLGGLRRGRRTRGM